MRLESSSVAASAGSIAATSANASHGSKSQPSTNIPAVSNNKRAAGEQESSSVPTIKRVKVNPPTLPLPQVQVPVPVKVTEKKLCKKEVPIFGHDGRLSKQLEAAAAEAVAAAQQLRNKRPTHAIDEAIDVAGGKRIRIEAPADHPSQVISSNNGNGRPRPNCNRRRNNGTGPIPICRWVPTPTAAPTEATAATSTATTGIQAASDDLIYSSSDESSIPSDDESLTGMPYLPSMQVTSPGQQFASSSDSWDDNYSQSDSEMSDIDDEDETSLVGINLLPRPRTSMDNGDAASKIQALFRGYSVRNMKQRATPQLEFNANGVDGQEQEWDDSCDGDDDSAVPIEAARADDDDEEVEPHGLMLILDAIDVKESLQNEDSDSSMAEEDDASERFHFDMADNAVEEDDDDVPTAKSRTEEDDEESSTVSSQPRFFEFDAAAMNVDDDDGQESVNLDAASYASKADDTEAIGEEEHAVDEDEEAEVAQPAPRRRPRMLYELQSTLDGWYWREATTRRVIVRD